jgi:hypothetical protein
MMLLVIKCGSWAVLITKKIKRTDLILGGYQNSLKI